MLRGDNIAGSDPIHRKIIVAALVTAVSQTGVPFFAVKPDLDSGYVVEGVSGYARTLAGSVTANVINVRNGTGIITVGGLAITAAAEKFKTAAASFYAVAGVLKTKAATDNLVFSSAYTVNLAAGATTNHWGAFLVQINAAGTISTKAVSADQDYATEALAVAALPDPDAAQVALGYITIRSKASAAWTANTDDMTDASDVTTADFYDTAPLTVLADPITFVSLTDVEGVLETPYRTLSGLSSGLLYAVFTSDGTGVLTNGHLKITIRAAGLSDEGQPPLT